MLFGIQNNEIIALMDAEILYDENFLSNDEATAFFESLRQNTDWQQDRIKIFGALF